MKILGVDFTSPSNVVIPVIKGNTEVIFQAACIVDFKEMEEVLKEPIAPMMVKRGSLVSTPDFEDKDYKLAMNQYSLNKINWLVSKSLLATEGLTWETVDFGNPETWKNYATELKEAGFNDFQINTLVAGVMEANGLSDSRIEEARKRFLAGQLAKQ